MNHPQPSRVAPKVQSPWPVTRTFASEGPEMPDLPYSLAGLCRRMRGATYLPSYAANTLQAWLGHDPSSAGLNTVRA